MAATATLRIRRCEKNLYFLKKMIIKMTARQQRKDANPTDALRPARIL